MDPENFYKEYKNKHGRRFSRFLRLRHSILLWLVASFILILFSAGIMSIPFLETAAESNLIIGFIITSPTIAFLILFFVHSLLFTIQLIAQDTLGYQKSHAIDYHIAKSYVADNREEKWAEFLKIDKILRQSPNTELSDVEEKILRQYLRTIKLAKKNEKEEYAIEETIDDYITQYISQKKVFRTNKLQEIIKDAEKYKSPSLKEKALNKSKSRRLEKVLNWIAKNPNKSIRTISTVLLITYIAIAQTNFENLGVIEGIIGAMYAQIIWNPENALTEILALKSMINNILDEIKPN